jgi:hypothetical protein
MEDGLNRTIELVFDNHFEKIVFLDIIGEGQIPQVLPFPVCAKLVNDKDVSDLPFV